MKKGVGKLQPPKIVDWRTTIVGTWMSLEQFDRQVNGQHAVAHGPVYREERGIDTLLMQHIVKFIM